jgi:hypothetical protein
MYVFACKCYSALLLNRFPLQVSQVMQICHEYHLYINGTFALTASQRPPSTLKENVWADNPNFRQFFLENKLIIVKP